MAVANFPTGYFFFFLLTDLPGAKLADDAAGATATASCAVPCIARYGLSQLGPTCFLFAAWV